MVQRSWNGMDNQLTFWRRCCCKKPLCFKHIFFLLEYIWKWTLPYEIHKLGHCDLIWYSIRTSHLRCLQTTYGLSKSCHLDMSWANKPYLHVFQWEMFWPLKVHTPNKIPWLFHEQKGEFPWPFFYTKRYCNTVI